MAVNKLLTISMITNEALRILENHLSFTGKVNREYDDQFAKTGAKIGSSLNIRKPVKYTVTTGSTLNVSNTEESSVTLTITNQDHVGMEFGSAEMALSLDDFSNRVLKPAISELANRIDFNGLKLVNLVPNVVGSATALSADMKTFLAAKTKLDNEAAPRDDDRHVVISSSAESGLVDGLKSIFNSQPLIAEQYRKGIMGYMGGFEFGMDQNVQTHTNGTGVGSPVIVNGANQTGATTLTVSGLVGTVNAGDRFTIAGVFAVNPKSKQSTGKLRDFVVVNDVAANGTAFTISPAMVATGPGQNVTALPANSAPLTFVGGPSAQYEVGVAFHKDAFTLACADLPLPKGVEMAARASDSQLGLSIRVVSDYNITEDKFVTRIDVLYGWQLIRPELACAIISDPTKL